MHVLKGPARSGAAQRAAPPTQRLRLRCPRASASPSSSSFDADAARRAFADPHTSPLRPGSEHGEAFSTMIGPLGSGGARRLDVDALNESLAPSGALRLRHQSMKPDEQHGAVFAFDSVVADLAPVKEAAWRLLARRRGLPLTEAGLRALASNPAPADVLATRVLGWARSWEEGRRVALEHAALGAELLASEGPDLVMEALSDAPEGGDSEGGGRQEAAARRAWADAPPSSRGSSDDVGGGDGSNNGAAQSSSSSPALLVPHPLALARDGAREWLDALTRHGVPCAAVSSLDRRTLLRALERVGLHDHFDALVSSEDEPESLADRLLTACVKLRRPPRAVASFDATPEGITAAHNASMRCVAVAGGGGGAGGGAGGWGRHSRHALRGADLTVVSLRELSVINVRRLFAGAETPGQLQLAREGVDRQRGDGGGGSSSGPWAGHRWSSRRATASLP